MDKKEIARLLPEVKKVLVIKLRHHGDVLLTTPVFNRLRQRLLGAELDVLIYAETRDMICHHPQVRKTYCVDRTWKKRGTLNLIKEETKLLRQLRSEAYDLIINLSDNWRGAALCRSLNAKLTASESFPRRQSKHWAASFSVCSPAVFGDTHTVERNLKVLDCLFGIEPSEAHYDIGISKAAEQSLNEKFSYPHEKKLAVIHPGARWSFKCWENSHWARVIDHLSERGFYCVLSGSPAAQEQQDIEEIIAASEHKPRSLCGALSLQELAALIKSCDLFLGVDSAPAHMAAALKKPAIALYGPSNLVEWRPYSDTVVVMTPPEGSELPDIDNMDTSSNERHLSSISAEDVITRLQ